MLTINATVEVRDVNGNIIPQPAPPKPKWTPALRFYRLSQNTNDLYEAYRNAFLSFEFLLNEIHSIPMKKNGKPSQGERDWFKDALTVVNSKINLTDYVPQGTSDPIEYIVKSQYDDIRCKLFHAKGVFIGQCPLNIIVPADTFNPIEVSNAYEQLMILVKQILIVYNNIIFAGGVVTHQGFKLMMWNNLSNGYALFANADDSPINGDLIEKRMFPLAEEQLTDQEQLLSKIFSQISPKNIDYKSLLNLQHDVTVPGIVSISGEITINELNGTRLIHRTFLVYKDVMFNFVRLIVFYNKDGLHLSGIDKFESNINIKLKNKGYPQK